MSVNNLLSPDRQTWKEPNVENLIVQDQTIVQDLTVDGTATFNGPIVGNVVTATGTLTSGNIIKGNGGKDIIDSGVPITAISNSVTSTSNITSNKVVVGDTGVKTVKETVVGIDGSGNLTGVNNISTVSQINGLNGAYLEFIDETPGNAPSIRSVSNQPWGIGASHTSDLNAHLSIGYFPAISSGLVYAFRQGDGPKNIQYGFPGFAVGHNFEGRITSSTRQLNNLTIPNITGVICTYGGANYDRHVSGKVFVSPLSIFDTDGSCSVVKNGNGDFTVNVAYTSTAFPVVTFADLTNWGFISASSTSPTAFRVVIRNSVGTPTDYDFTFSFDAYV